MCKLLAERSCDVQGCELSTEPFCDVHAMLVADRSCDVQGRGLTTEPLCHVHGLSQNVRAMCKGVGSPRETSCEEQGCRTHLGTILRCSRLFAECSCCGQGCGLTTEPPCDVHKMLFAGPSCDVQGRGFSTEPSCDVQGWSRSDRAMCQGVSSPRSRRAMCRQSSSLRFASLCFA